MPKQKQKKTTTDYSFLAIKITGYHAAIDSSINYEVRDRHHHYPAAKVYSFGSRLELEGVCHYPAERDENNYAITVYGAEREADQFAMTLADCQVYSEDRLPVYRKSRGKEVPVYDVPKGVGLLERERGTPNWHGWLWVPPQTVTDMLTLIPQVKPLYLAIQQLREGRKYWIVSLTLQTNDPAVE